MKRATRRPGHFIADGEERYHAAILPEIVAAVRAEFAEQLATAPLLARMGLRLAMRREIRRRLEAAASSRALY